MEQEQHIAEILLIEQTDETPLISLNPEDRRYEISGDSHPSEGIFFYQPVLNWISKYGVKHFTADTEFRIEMEYLNTPTSKALLMIFQQLDIFFEKGLFKQVVWIIKDMEDTDALDHIEDYGDFINISIECINNENSEKGETI